MTVDREFYVVMAKQHHPVWFSRHVDDYPGTDYTWATKYCESVKQSISGTRMVLCLYEAYCLAGPGNDPAGGHYKDEPGGYVQWSPMSNYYNAWVQVSSDGGNGCTPHLTEDVDDLDGIKAQTRYVLCCMDLDKREEETLTTSTTTTTTTTMTTTTTTTTSTPSSSIIASPTATSSSSSIAQEYEEAERHEPKWYD